MTRISKVASNDKIIPKQLSLDELILLAKKVSIPPTKDSWWTIKEYNNTFDSKCKYTGRVGGFIIQIEKTFDLDHDIIDHEHQNNFNIMAISINNQLELGNEFFRFKDHYSRYDFSNPEGFKDKVAYDKLSLKTYKELDELCDRIDNAVHESCNPILIDELKTVRTLLRNK